jgi:hypothetical protein
MEPIGKPKRRWTGVVRGSSLVAAAILAWRGACAFDTGYHFDLTESVLREEGFSPTPTQVVQVANWLTDFYTARPLSRENVKSDLAKLHFDNLYSAKDVARYWGWLMHNAREATIEAARAEDIPAMLAVMGVTLHAAQDFVSHSNWIEAHRAEIGAPYRRETWLADAPPEGVELFTGSYPPYPSPPPAGHPEHGGYDFGLNKDSQVRPKFAEAYVTAYCTTHEVMAAFREWAEDAAPGFWAKLKEYRLDEVERKRLDLDLEAAFSLSMWVKGKGSEGHWKGGDSGSTRYLSGLALEWTSSPASVIVQQFKKRRVQERLASGLYSTEAPPPRTVVPGFAGDRIVVEVGITHFAETRGEGRRIDRGRKADLFAVTTVGSERYVDRVLRGKKRYTNPWLTVHLAEGTTTEIPIRIEVWDQDETFGRKDDLCDINPAPEKRDLKLTLRLADDRLQGDVEGVYNSPERPFEIGGAQPDDMRVLIRGYVRTRKLASR